MTRSATVRRLTSILIAMTLVAAFAAPAAAVDGDKYVALANAKRASVNLPPVALVSAIETVSHERANQMASSDDFSHDLAYVSSRMKALGVCFTGYGEIIAWEKGYPTYDPARTMEQWWKSPGHHDIIVGNYNAAGGSHKTSPTSGKLYSVMIFAKLCNAPVASTSNTDIQRLAGGDRYATAAAISKSRFATGASTVFIATGGSFPDALAGSPAAAKANGPILLTKPWELPSATANELSRLKPSKIVILGGTGAVNSAVAEALRPYATSGTVSRLAGADRYATAVQVSRASYGNAGSDAVFVATGSTFPDGLAGSPVAALVPGPLLLVGRTSLPGSVANELDRLNPDRVYVLGGTGSVSDGVVRSIDATLP